MANSWSSGTCLKGETQQAYTGLVADLRDIMGEDFAGFADESKGTQNKSHRRFKGVAVRHSGEAKGIIY